MTKVLGAMIIFLIGIMVGKSIEKFILARQMKKVDDFFEKLDGSRPYKEVITKYIKKGKPKIK